MPLADNITTTIWGLNPVELHDRFWASRGVQVVRLGQPSIIVPHAELLMLTDPRTLAIFRLASILDDISWTAPDLVSLRLRDRRKGEYAERILVDHSDNFLGFSRLYEGIDHRIRRVGVTTDPEVAKVWQEASDPRTAWKRLRRLVPPQSRYAAGLDARVFDSDRPHEQSLFVRELIRRWRRPDATINGIAPAKDGVWTLAGSTTPAGSTVRAPIWIGAGRALPADTTVIGPAVLWDDPAHRPAPAPVEWLGIEPFAASLSRAGAMKHTSRPLKRLFDIVFSLAALLLTLPLFPLIALAILIEDGRPVFFGHLREARGGRRFKCIKFRSMRKDAEQIKAGLATINQADGPQFFITNDPRLTRVGRILRDLQVDELPQFFNVLKGDMSVVGPRPSPFRENQYCPPWREARLSVRPGITGLWQISRTRAAGSDFQEWIKYDIQYVERQSITLDIWIIYRTVLLLIRKALK